MRFTVPFAALISAISVLAEAEVKPFAKFDDLKLRTPSELARRQSCAAYGYVSCGVGCMPSDGECCDSEGDFCYSGDYCTATGCCENGEVCRAGSGGVITNYLPDITTSRYTTSYSYSRATSSAGFVGGSGDSGDDGDSDTSFDFDDDSTSGPATRTTATANNAAAATTTSAASSRSTSRSSSAVASAGGNPVMGNSGAFAAAGAGQVWAAGAIAAGVAMF